MPIQSLSSLFTIVILVKLSADGYSATRRKEEWKATEPQAEFKKTRGNSHPQGAFIYTLLFSLPQMCTNMNDQVVRQTGAHSYRNTSMNKQVYKNWENRPH